MIIPERIRYTFKKSVFFTAVYTVAGLLLLSCRHDEASRADSGTSTAVVHINTASPETKGINDSDINDIAIFVFNGDGTLVGYLYETGLTGRDERTFPMNLTESGALDFYVIANSERGFYHLVDEDDRELDLSGDLDSLPDNITPERLWNSRVELDSSLNAQGDWYVPMNNLPGSGLINFRFTVRSQSTTVIPIDLTRAVSKIEVWFRSNDQTTEPPKRESSSKLNLVPGQDYDLRSYYSIKTLNLSMPVTSARTYTGTPEYGTRDTASQNGPFNYQNVGGFGSGFPDYDPDDIPNNFYSGDYFAKIWEFYIFPNLYGGNSAGELTGNSAGELTGGSSETNCTTLDIDYFLSEENGSYNEKVSTTEWGPWQETTYTYTWVSNGYTDGSTQNKKVILPACERNSNIRVWCALNDDTDRSFTYTVSDWDETVTVNVPDFE